jgi:putative colanic acid biosysnthesis UDP-glucose lipid carrier transferase
MNETVVPRKSLAVSILLSVEIAAPAVIAVACLYASILAYDIQLAPYFQAMALVLTLLSLLLLRPARARDRNLLGGFFSLAVGIFARWLVLIAALLAIAYVTKFSTVFSRRVVLTWALLTPMVIVIATRTLDEILRRLLRNPSNARTAVIVGCTEASLALARRLTGNNDFCTNVVGYFEDRALDRLNIRLDLPRLGKLTELAAFVRRHAVEVAFIALPIGHARRVLDLVDELRDTTISIYYLPDIFVAGLIQARTGLIDGIPVVAMCETPFYLQRATSKRLMDVVLSTAVLLPAAPLMILIALCIRLTSRGPALFKQRRYGLHGEEIVIYKFRTMTVVEDGEVIVQAVRSDARFTPIGKFLRRHSLDELPQLINVLQGRMSLVGPRPHAVAHNELYRRQIKGYMLRHKVRPGITGLAQVNGMRGELRSIEQMEARLRYDLEYLRNWSIELDLEILARTVMRVLIDNKAF